MKKFPLDKYKYYTNGNKVYAVSTYAGKTVRGSATCHETDEFNEEVGKKLAALRCDLKVRRKRKQAADKKYAEAIAAYEAAAANLDKMSRYANDASEDYDLAAFLLEDYEISLHNPGCTVKFFDQTPAGTPVLHLEPITEISGQIVQEEYSPAKAFLAKCWKWLKEN